MVRQDTLAKAAIFGSRQVADALIEEQIGPRYVG
jgi:hypothetical protein